MLKRKKLLGGVLALMYVGTWIGGWISHAQDLSQRLSHQAEKSCRNAEHRNQESVNEENKAGIEPFLIMLHEGGPITRVWCVPLLPGILWEHWESSTGPLGGGGGNTVVFYYVFGSTELYRFGGWRN
jgi:hypothetical protein